jgi:hypothetical protein
MTDHKKTAEQLLNADTNASELVQFQPESATAIATEALAHTVLHLADVIEATNQPNRSER